MPALLTRRALGRLALAGAASAALPLPAAVAPARLPLFDFAIAGGWYHGLLGARDLLAVGERLRLVAEPDNPYDRYAVAVHRADGLKLGYIPRRAVPPIARLLASGATVEATIEGRLLAEKGEKMPAGLAFTSFDRGDPRIRLELVGAAPPAAAAPATRAVDMREPAGAAGRA